MKQTVVLAMVLVFCFSLTGVSSAGNLGSLMGTVKVAKESIGTISLIDNDALIITLKQKINDTEVEYQYALDRYTSIMKGDEIKTVADLNKGDKITIVYIREARKNVAKKIMISEE